MSLEIPQILKELRQEEKFGKLYKKNEKTISIIDNLFSDWYRYFKWI